MPTVQLEAIDTLFFRDGKPFTMGEDTQAAGIFPPFPSVIYGALRSTFIAQQLKTGQSLADLIKESEALKITGLYFYVTKPQEASRLYYPMPLDYVQLKASGTLKRVIPLKILATNQFVSSATTPYMCLSLSHVEAVQDGLFGAAQMEEYLDGKLNIQPISCISDFLSLEAKIGNTRHNVSRSTSGDNGNLYRTGLRRLENIAGHQIRLIVTYENLDIDMGSIKLGGEGKAAILKRYSESPLLEHDLLSEKHFKLLLLSPTIFNNGVLPSLTIFKRYGIELKLLSYVAGKSLPIGGWDIAKKRPKPMYIAVPAGSVYYYEILSDHTAKDILQVVKEETSISDYRSNEGFGLWTIATLNLEKTVVEL